MSKKEKIPTKSEDRETERPDDQVIIDLMAKRKLQQDALKKIMTSMDKSSEKNTASTASKGHAHDQTKLI